MWKPPPAWAATLIRFLGGAVLGSLVLMPVAPPARAAQPPKVVASIQPLHSLAAMVMDGVAQPALLVSGAQSEHGYALKPSDLRAIEQAQVVLMVDPGYETFMAKPLKAAKAQVIAMADLPGAIVLAPREGGVWEPHHHRDAHHDKEHGGHHHDGDDEVDGHVWLDPANARLAVVALMEKLIAIDPANAAAYRANGDKALAALARLDDALRARLAPLAGRSYVVFHDAYQYFEARYGLTPAGSITLEPDRPPSPQRVAALEARLTQAKAACVFREPQFPAPIVDSLAQAAGARVGVLDPQGAALPPGPTLYPLLLNGLADGLTSCLSPS